jgi:NADPH-dependent curcumin reductase CurA
MRNRSNRQVRLKSRPVGIPQAEHFEFVQMPVPAADRGQFVVRNRFLSVDPAMRGWVNAAANYSQPVGIGEVMRSFAVGEVVESQHAGYRAGDIVAGMFGWQEYALSDGSQVTRKVLESDLPMSLALGVLGLNGVTAYWGLLGVGEPKSGDTVVVSTASGSVGSAVGQIARIKGCRTIGIAGGAAKVKDCLELFGYDAALDYKAERDIAAALGGLSPQGVNVYFDNTSGAISDAVLGQLAVGARVVICGTASLSSWDPWPVGPRVERHLLVKRARMQGFLLFDWMERYGEAVAQLAQWVRAGKLHYQEDILDGIEQAPGAIAGLYRGDNRGKRLIRLSGD